ncbi:DNA modification system-associated small protein [Neisseriaceae bacterium B1]
MKPETQEQISDLLLWNDEESHQLMTEIAAKHNVHLDALADLVAWEREQQIRIRRRGMMEALDDIFDNQAYWK